MSYLTQILDDMIAEQGTDTSDGRRWAVGGVSLHGGAGVQGRIAKGEDGDGYVMIIQQAMPDERGRTIMGAFWYYFEGKDVAAVHAPIKGSEGNTKLMEELGLIAGPKLHSI